MRIMNRLVALVLLPMCLVTSPVLAQEARVVDASAMSQALADRVATENAQRVLVRRVLNRGDAREMAARMGLSAERADAAVSTLSSAELGVLAQHAGAIEATALAGGSNTIVISTTTALLLLVIAILLLK
jgi:hypothetical protein